MLARTGFPEYLESVAIGPSPEFLKTETDLCELANQFPTETNLTYLWKDVKYSSDQIPPTRTFIKNLLLDAPEISTEFLQYYLKKIDLLPTETRSIIYYETDRAFTKASNITPINVSSTRNFSDVRIDEDIDFIEKLADLLKSCVGPCNYFNSNSDKVGSLLDFSRYNTIHSAVPYDTDLNAAPPTGIGLNVYNKVPRDIQNTIAKACTSAKLLMDAAKAQFVDPTTAKKLEAYAKQGIAADANGVYYIGSTTPSALQKLFLIRTRALGRIRRRMGDCFRLFDFNHRYNAFDPSMNLASASERYFSLRLLSANGPRTFALNAVGQARYPNTFNQTAVEALGNIPNRFNDDVRISTISGSPTPAAQGKSVPITLPSHQFKTTKNTWKFFTVYSNDPVLDPYAKYDYNTRHRIGAGNRYLEEGDMALGTSIKRVIEGALNRTIKLGDYIQFTIYTPRETVIKTLRYCDVNGSDNPFGVDQFTSNVSTYKTLESEDYVNFIGNTYEVAYAGFRECLVWNNSLPGASVS